MIGYKSLVDNKISIFKNILINNNTAIAYYVLYPYNYDIMDKSSAERHIERLYNAINNLYSSFGELKISMFSLQNIISKKDLIDQITSTIKIYNKDYKGFPEKYRQYIKNISRDFSILAIQLDVKNSIDIEQQSLKNIIKSAFDNFVQTNFTTNNTKINLEALTSQNIRIKNILQRYAVPANEKLVMNIYINSLFPSYNLVYNDYLVKNANTILGGVKQEIIPHLGWFEMSNSGIADFGGIAKTTYGSIITILEFPDAIQSESFNLGVPRLHVNMHLLPKDKALLKFKRMRADIKQEQEEVDNANNSDSDVDEYADLAQRAIEYTRKGRVATEVDANILVLADSKEELDKKKKKVISILSDIHVVSSIAADQAKTFINSFVKNIPGNYFHLMDLQYGLSFQLDNGVLVGDQDCKYAAPVIGIC